MPIIPFENVPTVAPTMAPDAYNSTRASPDAFGAAAAQATQGVGQEFAKTGAELFQHNQAVQQLTNETLATDAETKTAMASTDILGRYRNLEGKDAVDGLKAAQAELIKVRQDIGATLPNPMARAAFNQLAARREAYYLGDMGGYAAQQHKVWATGTMQGAIETDIAKVGQAPLDEGRMGYVLGSIKYNANAMADLKGMTGAARVNAVQIETDKFWAARIDAVAAQPGGAQAAWKMFVDNRDQIGGQTQTAISKMLHTSVDYESLSNTAHAIVTGTGGHTNVDLDTLFDKGVVKQEGGISRTGEPLTSNKGAVGVAQLEPDAAKEAGVSLGIDSTNYKTDQGLNHELGKEYLRIQLQKYDGNQTLALAAYNAGPGAVDGWIKQFGDPSKGQISDADWLAKVPFKETQDYVKSINTRIAPTSANPPTDTDIMTRLSDLENQARDAAQAMRPGDGGYAEQMVARVRTEVGAISAGQIATRNASNQTLWGLVSGVGPNGAMGPKPDSVDQLLAMPGGRDAWMAVDNSTREQFTKVIEANAKKENLTPVNETTMGEYYRLSGEAGSNPEKFRSENLMDYYGKLPTGKLDALITQQRIMQSKDYRDQEKAVNWSHALATSAGLLKAAGIDTQPKDGTPAQKTLQQFAGRLSELMDSYKAQNKKNPDDEDIKSMTRNLLISGSQRGGFLWDSSGLRNFQVDPKAFYEDFPDSKTKQQFAAAWERQFGYKASDRQLQSFYTQYVFRNTK